MSNIAHNHFTIALLTTLRNSLITIGLDKIIYNRYSGQFSQQLGTVVSIADCYPRVPVPFLILPWDIFFFSEFSQDMYVWILYVN